MESRSLYRRSRGFLALILAAVVVCLTPVASQAIDPYPQDFEAMNPDDPYVLGIDGWLVWGNVSTPGGDFLYHYGPFPAPNNTVFPAFSALVWGEGYMAPGGTAPAIT